MGALVLRPPALLYGELFLMALVWDVAGIGIVIGIVFVLVIVVIF